MLENFGEEDVQYLGVPHYSLAQTTVNKVSNCELLGAARQIVLVRDN